MNWALVEQEVVNKLRFAMYTMASKFGKVNNVFLSHFTFSHLSDLLNLQQNHVLIHDYTSYGGG